MGARRDGGAVAVTVSSSAGAGPEPDPPMRLASLAMYAGLPEVDAANGVLWAAMRDRLRADGIDTPEALDTTLRHDEAWLDPRLLFAQACGLPYVERLRGRVRLVATPVYGFPGGRGAERASFVVVRATDEAAGLADLCGRRAAINDPGSNSGTNLFRAAVAPLARGGRFFSAVLETGSHLASLAAVSGGAADAAAIDSVTFGLVARHRPAALAGIRVLCETPAGPGLPFVTRAAADDDEVAALRRALAGAIADPATAGARDALGLAGFEILDDAAYDRLARLRDEAARRGYPLLA